MDEKQKEDCLCASEEKTRDGNFDLQAQTGEKEISVHMQAKETRNVCLFEHSKKDKGVKFVCKGWAAMVQEKLVIVRNESGVEAITVKSWLCAKSKNKKERMIRQKCMCINEL